MSIGAKRFLGVVLVAVALAGCSASESNDVAAAEPDSESTVADVTTTTPFPCSGPKGDLVEAEALELAIEAGGNQPMAVTEWRAQDGITKLGFGAAYQFDRPTDIPTSYGEVVLIGPPVEDRETPAEVDADGLPVLRGEQGGGGNLVDAAQYLIHTISTVAPADD